MGCTSSKGMVDEYKIKKPKRSKKVLKRLVDSSQRKIALEAKNIGNEATRWLISREHAEKSAGSKSALGVAEEKKLIVFERHAMPNLQRWATMESGLQGEKLLVCRALSVRGGIDGAHIVAGWPFWLATVAGEAINGWIPRKLESFEKLDKIGQGTYSNVYRAHDLETGKIVALKKVRFCNMDPESVRFMAREILILRRLDHPNVIKLEGVITSKVSSDLYLVFEYMEHDLAGLATSPMVKFTEPQIKCYMQQLLCGLEHCHSRGVLHRDIKGSNLLIDNNGNLKIGDFGLANLLCANQEQPLTSRVVTLWYRPPELLLGSTDYGIGVDLWSSGCILAELFVGKPLMPGRTEVEQLHKIFKICGSPSEEYWKKSKLPLATIFKPQHPYQRCLAEAFKDLSPSALALVESLLAFEPECRGSTTSALQSMFFLTEPLPCDPSSLPNYPSSKAFDAKMQNKEAQRVAGTRDGHESSRKGSKKSQRVPIPDPNAESQAAMHKLKRQPNQWYHPKEDSGSGFPRGSLQSGHSMQIGASGKSLAIVDEEPNLNNLKAVDFKIQSSYKPQAEATRASSTSQLDFNPESKCYKQLNNAESSYHVLGKPDCSYKNNGRMYGKEITMGNAVTKTPSPYFGPLFGGSMERMVREHQKRIQVVVKRARIDKNKTRKCCGEDGQTNPLLQCIIQK